MPCDMRFPQSRLSTIAVFWVVVLCNTGTSILICEETLIHEYPSTRRHVSQARRQQSSWYAMSTVPIKCSSDHSSPKRSKNRWCLLQADQTSSLMQLPPTCSCTTSITRFLGLQQTLRKWTEIFNSNHSFSDLLWIIIIIIILILIPVPSGTVEHTNRWSTWFIILSTK